MVRSAIFIEPNQPLQIREYPTPSLESGAILAKVRLATICGSDLHTFLGSFYGHSSRSAAAVDKLVLENGFSVDAATYGHYLHHKYFECNYAGDTTNFLDKLFGAFHDGSDKATEALKQRLRRRASAR